MAYPFDTTATVYGENVATGEYTTVVRSALACRLVKARGTATTAPDRADLAAERDLIFDPTYVMPDFAQVLVAGHAGLWATVRGTFATLVGPSGAAHHRRVIVRRQDQ